MYATYTDALSCCPPGACNAMNSVRPHSAASVSHLTATTTSPHPADTAAYHSVNTAGVSPGTHRQDTGRPVRAEGDGGLRARLTQLLDTRTVPHPPAVRFEGDWQTVTEQICGSWANLQAAQSAQAISLVALARMKALDYERKHRDAIPETERILAGKAGKHDYYKAQMDAFLDAMGIRGEELDALLESFRRAGTGGLHRQHVTAAATAQGLIGGASQFVTAQNPAAGAALYGLRLLLVAGIAERIMDSGWRRMRNAGTEDIMPHGRADASPSAKQAPNVFEASHEVIWKLLGARKNLSQMEAAMVALENARAASDAHPDDDHRRGVERAREDLEIAYARICHQLEVKASYKTSSESAKIEFRGNQRYLAASYTGATLSLGAGLFSILTPVLGAAAAPATGGITVGVAALVMLLYAGYQLSSGPSQDGEAKAKRAIVALSKSVDVLRGDRSINRELRAAAYRTYLEDRKAARFRIGESRTAGREAARAKLSLALQEILHEESAAEHMDTARCWEAYRAHRNGHAAIDGQAARERWPQERMDEQKQALDRQFQARHQSDFSTSALAEAWKNPIRTRLDATERLLKGKAAQSHARLIGLIRPRGLKARLLRHHDEQAIASAKSALRENLRDMFNLGLAARHMQRHAGRTGDAGSSASADLTRATAALGAIEDADVRSVFCGDGKAQVDAVNKAKKLTAGEAERYVLTNLGASVPGIGLNAAVGATDLGLSAAKAADAVHVGLYDANPEAKPRIPKYADYKFAAVSQAGAPLTAHMNAGDRAAFQKKRMQDIHEITAPPDRELAELVVSFSSDIGHLDKDSDEANGKLDALVEQLAAAEAVPARLILALPARDGGRPGTDNTATENIAFDLRSTAGYQSALHRNASPKKKLKVAAARTGIVLNHAWLSFAGLPAQGIAQYNLKRTRATLNRASELDQGVRNAVIAAANADIVPRTAGTDTVPDRDATDPGPRDEDNIDDMATDPVFQLIREYYRNEARLAAGDD